MKSVVIGIRLWVVIEEYTVIKCNKQQIDLIGYHHDIIKTRFEKEKLNELEFKFKNKNVNCGDAFNEIIYFDNKN